MNIKIDMIEAEVELVLSKKQLKKTIKKHGISFNLDDYVSLDGVCLFEGEKILVYVDGKQDRARRLRILVHELSHATTAIMDARDIRCDETRSYLLDYMFNEFLEYIESY